MGIKFFGRLEQWEKGLQVILALFFAFLIIFQILMAREPFRFYLSFAERMEGIPWSEGEPAASFLSSEAVGEIKIKLCSYFLLPKAAVFINGREAARFQEQEVILRVRSGDELLIDGSAYDCPLIFQVTAVSSGVCWPPANYRVTTNASQVSLGKVQIENDKN